MPRELTESGASTRSRARGLDSRLREPVDCGRGNIRGNDGRRETDPDTEIPARRGRRVSEGIYLREAVLRFGEGLSAGLVAGGAPRRPNSSRSRSRRRRRGGDTVRTGFAQKILILILSKQTKKILVFFSMLGLLVDSIRFLK